MLAGFAPGFAPRLDLIGDRVAGELLAVVTEGLSNAARHARAESVRVMLASGPGLVRPRVADDGVALGDGAVAVGWPPWPRGGSARRRVQLPLPRAARHRHRLAGALPSLMRQAGNARPVTASKTSARAASIPTVIVSPTRTALRAAKRAKRSCPATAIPTVV